MRIFSFDSFSSGGTLVINNNDVIAPIIPLGFTFFVVELILNKTE
jgi:hypothetical protein